MARTTLERGAFLAASPNWVKVWAGWDGGTATVIVADELTAVRSLRSVLKA